MGGGRPLSAAVAVLTALVVALLAFAGTRPRRHHEHQHQLVRRSAWGPSEPRRTARPLDVQHIHDPGQRRAPQRPHDAWTRPCTNCRITDMVPNLVFTSGSTANMQDGLLLHHFVIFNPAQTGHRLPDQRAVLRRRQRAHAPAPAVALRLPQHERDLEHDRAPREQEPRAADGQHRGRVPLAAGRRDRVRAARMARHRLDLHRRELRVHDSDRATPTRTATGPCRRTRASSACPATCTTSTSSTRVRVRCTARHAGRRSRSARSFWAATATTTSGRSRPTTRRPRTSRARRCAGRRRITGPRSGRRCGRTGTWTRWACAGSSARCPPVRSLRHTRPTARTRSRAIRSRPVR